jgi:hypothetical protein
MSEHYNGEVVFEVEGGRPYVRVYLIADACDLMPGEPEGTLYASERSHAYVNVYSVDRSYGGPEEGGWWFNSGTPVAAVPVSTEGEEVVATQRLRALFPLSKRPWCQTDYRIVLEPNWPEPYPAVRPHYE